MTPTLGTGPSGPLAIDVERLVETRMLLQANSGGGKSWALRRLLEQTHGHVQHLVLDVEGEFYTLRERFDYVLARAGVEGRDCPAEPRSAHLLARKLLELCVSAIIDIYELKADERSTFVQKFLEALIAAPRTLWHPALIVVDEAHLFCPQSGSAESAGAVIDLMTRGRKRGFCGVLASQRLAKLHKDAAAEANNKLIGRTGLDVDAKRAADELGFGKDDQRTLRTLSQGSFYAFGPALSIEVARVQVGEVSTTHPRGGQRSVPTPPPRARVQAVLGELADLPAEAVQEERTCGALEARVRELQRELRAARAGSGAPSPEQLERARMEGRREAEKRIAALVAEVNGRTGQAARLLEQGLGALGKLQDVLREPLNVEIPASSERTKPELRRRALALKPPQRQTSVPPAARAREAGDGPDLGKGERATLIAIAQHIDGVDRVQLSILTGYRRSTRDAYIQRLRAAGLIEESGGAIGATEAGLVALGDDYQPLPTGAALREHWLTELPEGEAKVLQLLIDAHPGALERQDIDAATGYARSSRDAYIQRLAARKLVQCVARSQVRASDVLFLRAD